MTAARSWLHDGTPKTKRALARKREVEAKRDLVVEAAVAWVDGASDEATLREAVRTLKRAQGSL